MSLRILTINLYNGRADADSLASILRVHSPDVVAAQELSANSAEVLAAWGSFHLLDSRNDLTGMGIAVRGPALLSRLEFPNRNPVTAVLDSDDWDLNGDVEIVNVHLMNPIARPLRETRRLRREELSALEGLLAGQGENTSRVLVGDLNSSPAWPIYRRMATLATDAAVAAGTARRSWGPWPSFPRVLRIDHAFVQGLRPLRTRLVTVRGADHRGLLIDLESSR